MGNRWTISKFIIGFALGFLALNSAYGRDEAFQSKSFSQIEFKTERYEFQGESREVHLHSGYFNTSSGQKVYFEYRVPEDFAGEDIVQISGLNEGADFWQEPNKHGLFFKKAGILTLDTLAIGKTRVATFSSKPVPESISFSDDARVIKELIEALKMKSIVIQGHSRGAAVAADLAKRILDSGKIKIKALYDLNGFVSYISNNLLGNTFPLQPMGSHFYLKFSKKDQKGEITEIEFSNYQEYIQEIFLQWSLFEKEFHGNKSKYSKYFIEGATEGDEVNPRIREVTAEEYNYLQLKYPLLVNTYSYQSVHELALASLVARRLPVEDEEPRGHGFAATMAQLRAQRTVFSSGRRQYYIPHSTVPLLAEVAKKGVPIILLGATSDLIVRKIHLELKKAAVEGTSGTQVKIIWDEAGSEKGVDPHYGPHRSVWSNKVLEDFPVAQSQSRFKGCIIKLVEILTPSK